MNQIKEVAKRQSFRFELNGILMTNRAHDGNI